MSTRSAVGRTRLRYAVLNVATCHAADCKRVRPTLAGAYAVMEAKYSNLLGQLGEAGGFRQASKEYIRYNLNKYADIPGADMQMVNAMKDQLRAGNLESFASLKRADRLVQFDLQKFIGNQAENLNANKYFINKNIPW